MQRNVWFLPRTATHTHTHIYIYIWKMAVGLAHTRPNESILIWSSFAVQYCVCGITKWKDDLVCLALALCSRCIDKTVLLLNMKTMWQSLNTVLLCSSGWGSYCCLAKECQCVEHLILYSFWRSKLPWIGENYNFLQRKLLLIARFCYAKRCYGPKFRRKIFASHKTANFAKVFLPWKFPAIW